ncbi:hypothetical protein ABH935_007122 [Catenulispora sp. GAS73]|uniref:hypothetical protein n=1 Tax=Catenulispora sp. GAS73 TaxID=3156269 RepID=UPI003513262E
MSTRVPNATAITIRRFVSRLTGRDYSNTSQNSDTLLDLCRSPEGAEPLDTSPTKPFDEPRLPTTSCSAGSTNSKNATATTSRASICDNLIARIAEAEAEAEREGWLGEVEGLQVGLAGAEEELAHMERAATRTPIVHGLPVVSVTVPGPSPSNNLGRA